MWTDSATGSSDWIDAAPVKDWTVCDVVAVDMAWIVFGLTRLDQRRFKQDLRVARSLRFDPVDSHYWDFGRIGGVTFGR